MGHYLNMGHYIFNRLSQSQTINIFTPVRTYTSMISTTIQQEELEKQTYRATIRAWAIIRGNTVDAQFVKLTKKKPMQLHKLNYLVTMGSAA